MASTTLLGDSVNERWQKSYVRIHFWRIEKFFAHGTQNCAWWPFLFRGQLSGSQNVVIRAQGLILQQEQGTPSVSLVGKSSYILFSVRALLFSAFLASSKTSAWNKVFKRRWSEEHREEMAKSFGPKSVLRWESLFYDGKVCFTMESLFYDGKVCFTMGKSVLRWKVCFTMGKSVLRWESLFYDGKFVLRWESLFYDGKVCFTMESLFYDGKVCFTMGKSVLRWKVCFTMGKSVLRWESLFYKIEIILKNEAIFSWVKWVVLLQNSTHQMTLLYIYQSVHIVLTDLLWSEHSRLSI